MSNDDKKLLDVLQTEFPIVPEPFKYIAGSLNSTEGNILNSIKELKDSGSIRRIGPIFDANRFGYTSALFGVQLPLEQEESAANYISTFEGVTHNYHRDDEMNLWFTLTSKTEEEMNQTIEDIKTKINPQKLLKLRSKKTYKIRAVFTHSHCDPGHCERSEAISNLEIASSPSAPRNDGAFKVLQDDLPITHSPFKPFADKLGLDENNLLKIITDAKATKLIRRYGAIVSHTKSGFDHNVMMVFNVPSDTIDDVGQKTSEKYYVSHCYERELLPEWPFNFYAMVHAETEEESIKCIEEIKTIADGYPVKILRSGKEYKKSSLRIL